MKSTPELEAEMLRLHYAEHWPVGRDTVLYIIARFIGRKYEVPNIEFFRYVAFEGSHISQIDRIIVYDNESLQRSF